MQFLYEACFDFLNNIRLEFVNNSQPSFISDWLNHCLFAVPTISDTHRQLKQKKEVEVI